MNKSPQSSPIQPYTRIGMVARWKPVHLGHQAVLRAMCRSAGQVLVGVGSANRYNLRNPFTLDETLDMLRLALDGFDNFTLLAVPDLDDGPRWRLMVCDLFGSLDVFLTANPYVASLMHELYPVLHPVSLLSPAERQRLDGAMVRREMARGGDWGSMLPPAVSAYIRDRQLDDRFRREFGLATLTLDALIE